MDVRSRCFACLVLLATWAAAARADAQTKPPAPPASAPQQAAPANHGNDQDESVADDSPRASMAQFVEACRAGRFQDAAEYLDVPRALKGREAQLAERLKAVMDRKAWIDLDKISPLSTGDLDDGLPHNQEEIGRFRDAHGVPEPVRLIKHPSDQGRWHFTANTVSNVDRWYAGLDDRWMRENMPAWLLRRGPHELLFWQWFALPLVLLLAWLVGYALSRLSAMLLSAFTARTSLARARGVIQSLRKPFTLCWGVVVVFAILPWLDLYQPALHFIQGILRAALLVGVFWILSRGVSIAGTAVTRSPWARHLGASSALIPLGTRVGHVALFSLALVAILSQLGYPVASLIAGLGVGGLAVALAAQKTLENLFGAFAIGVDQPFREGDFVRVDDFSGTVESIGLRSTKFRTPDRTVISIPNGKLADMKVESFARRDRLRFACTVSLVYGTSREQVRKVIAGIERSLGDQPKVARDGRTARFLQFGSSSLDIEVAAWFETLDGAEFQRMREELLLSFMQVIEEAGTALALPMRGMRGSHERAREELGRAELRDE